MIIRRYEKRDFIIWNEFIKLAKNYHFFFERNYMDYHADRFVDHSLMIYDNKNSLIALLPANILNNKLFSHQGLTFGGLIIKNNIKQKEILEIFSCLKQYLKDNNIVSCLYKKIPYIYHNMPCDEDLYGLFRINATLIRRDASSTIYLENQIKYSKGRKWIVKRSKDSGLEFKETEDIDFFWEKLEEVLFTNHQAVPTHSLEEIKKLKSLFPDNIKFFISQKDNVIIAGSVIFEINKIAHTQYLFNTQIGREYGALDGLIDFLVKDIYKEKKYFDFGISNEEQGRILNEGLIAQKEGFGARTIVHDFYEILAND
ncbi:GNAT family N-acetyltransferase [Photobacterium damselae subsp. damselae]|uniref:GNAT family N-acetyltransferase n=1 Tax=Photobacterium damselae TaxID=38293 RepID=UPI00083B04A0|nr:GNAT family N-acetyltransferase [Photobacterium damselae]QSH58000.1 GNAT family N-acetyltransferase [Photobacterium damselae subsp. damselae]